MAAECQENVHTHVQQYSQAQKSMYLSEERAQEVSVTFRSSVQFEAELDGEVEKIRTRQFLQNALKSSTVW